nr:flotillin-like protein 4 [Tanacetum cinerariifolium]
MRHMLGVWLLSVRNMLSVEKFRPDIFPPCLDGIVSKLGDEYNGLHGAQGMSCREQLNTHVKENKVSVLIQVAKASEYLVITGIGINDIKIAKKAWILPGQSSTKIDLSPVNYTFEVQATSAEKLPFILPVVFIIGPRTDDKESLQICQAHHEPGQKTQMEAANQAKVDVSEAKMK